MAKKNAGEDLSSREIVVSRSFDAPAELVWLAWTDPKHIVQWWGPVGFKTTILEMDVRPGGVWRHTMHGPDGTDYPNSIVFVEVVKPHRIVFHNEGGREGSPKSQFKSTWTFEEKQGRTTVTIRMVFPSQEERDFIAKTYGAVEGGKQTLARLEDYIRQELQ